MKTVFTTQTKLQLILSTTQTIQHSNYLLHKLFNIQNYPLNTNQEKTQKKQQQQKKKQQQTKKKKANPNTLV